MPVRRKGDTMPEVQVRRRAKNLLDQGHTPPEVAAMLSVKPAEVKSWIRQYEWGEPIADALTVPVPDDAIAEEFSKLMRRDCIDTLNVLRTLPKTKDTDELLKRERIKELLGKRAERELGKTAEAAGANAKTVINIAAMREFNSSKL